MKQFDKSFVFIALAFLIGTITADIGEPLCAKEYIFTWWKASKVIAIFIAIAYAGYISGKAN